MNEIWKPVVEFAGLYEVSDLGRVKSLERTCAHGSGIGTRRVHERILRPRTYRKYGHLSVTLYRDGKKFSRDVHRLVLEAHEGPRPNGLECCHEDGNPANNHLSNLRWDTHAANMVDSVRHGTSNRGGHGGGVKLRESDVLFIRKMISKSWRQRDLAKFFGVSQPNISDIANRKRWEHVA